MSTDVSKIDKVAMMYRTFVHMQHGRQDELSGIKESINNLQDEEVLQIRPEGGDYNAQKTD